MRLLNTSSLTLEVFGNWNAPKYAILSHMWGKEEVTFEDLDRGKYYDRLGGWPKIKSAAEIARKEGYGHIWIDTCCIDKSSSAELSEAINSMFRWYREASICYAFLSDVSSPADDEAVGNSRWMTRGWTLQELIAPPRIDFYDSLWSRIGSKCHEKESARFVEILSRATGIRNEILLGGDLAMMSVAQRMSWAAKRQTERPEDRAYCLMGLFDVNMPLLYGEGGQKAFFRLQEEILKSTDDETLFAWRWKMEPAVRHISQEAPPFSGLLAPDPSCFADGRWAICNSWRSGQSRIPAAMTNRGLHLAARLSKHLKDHSDSLYWAALSCTNTQNSSVTLSTYYMILLQRLMDDDSGFIRARPDILVTMSPGGGKGKIRIQRQDTDVVERKDSVAGNENGDDDASLYQLACTPVPRDIFVAQSLPPVRFYYPIFVRIDRGAIQVSVRNENFPVRSIDVKGCSMNREREDGSYDTDLSRWRTFETQGNASIRFSFGRNLALPLLEPVKGPIVLTIFELRVPLPHLVVPNPGDCSGCQLQDVSPSEAPLQLLLGLDNPPTAPSRTSPTHFIPWYSFRRGSGRGGLPKKTILKTETCKYLALDPTSGSEPRILCISFRKVVRHSTCDYDVVLEEFEMGEKLVGALSKFIYHFSTYFTLFSSFSC